MDLLFQSVHFDSLLALVQQAKVVLELGIVAPPTLLSSVVVV